MKKWGNIRDNYIKWLRKGTTSSEGSTTYYIRHRSYVYANQLTFLKKVFGVRQSGQVGFQGLLGPRQPPKVNQSDDDVNLQAIKEETGQSPKESQSDDDDLQVIEKPSQPPKVRQFGNIDLHAFLRPSQPPKVRQFGNEVLPAIERPSHPPKVRQFGNVNLQALERLSQQPKGRQLDEVDLERPSQPPNHHMAFFQGILPMLNTLNVEQTFNFQRLVMNALLTVKQPHFKPGYFLI